MILFNVYTTLLSQLFTNQRVLCEYQDDQLYDWGEGGGGDFFLGGARGSNSRKQRSASTSLLLPHEKQTLKTVFLILIR